jgi:superfamily II DNA/RNA helicase
VRPAGAGGGCGNAFKELPYSTKKLSYPPFQRRFWAGPSPEAEPPEDLKLQRKAMGVLVRGKYELCPPPVMCANDPLLPASFGAVFESSKFVSPTPAQAQCWPAILSGANVLCISVTGSGKTLAYGLPMIPHISARIRDKSALISDTADASPLALVLVPTRELAIQVARSFRCFQKVASISSFAIYGGKDKEESIDELKSGFPCHIIVATPGRLIDLVGSGVVSLGNVSYLVIDEADRMLQLGFDDQLNCILSHLRPDRQSHLFSATFPGKLRDACAKWIGAEVVSIRVGELSLRELPDRNKSQSNEPELQKPKEHIATEDSSSSMCAPSHPEAITHGTPPKDMDITSLTLSRNVAQDVHVCVTHKKPRLLIRYIERIRKEELQQNTRQPGLMLIFCEKIKTLIYISNFLEKNNVVCRILHGQLNQNLREQNLNDFRSVNSIIKYFPCPIQLM